MGDVSLNDGKYRNRPNPETVGVGAAGASDADFFFTSFGRLHRSAPASSVCEAQAHLDKR